jgi:hypothetical protein
MFTYWLFSVYWSWYIPHRQARAAARGMSFADLPEPGDGECNSFTFIHFTQNFLAEKQFADPIMLSVTGLCFPAPRDMRWNCYICERMAVSCAASHAVSPPVLARPEIKGGVSYFHTRPWRKDLSNSKGMKDGPKSGIIIARQPATHPATRPPIF